MSKPEQTRPQPDKRHIVQAAEYLREKRPEKYKSLAADSGQKLLEYATERATLLAEARQQSMADLAARKGKQLNAMDEMLTDEMLTAQYLNPDYE